MGFLKKPWESKYLILLGIFPTVILLDQWTKFLIYTHFRWGESVPVIQSFVALTYVRNSGGAFSLFHNAPPALRDPFFLVVPIVALVVIGIIFIRLTKEQGAVAVALSLIMAGAIGNLIDRIRFGYVVDFLDIHWKEVYHWPAFNVADACIVIGVTMMFFDAFFAKKPASGKLETKSS